MYVNDTTSWTFFTIRLCDVSWVFYVRRSFILRRLRGTDVLAFVMRFLCSSCLSRELRHTRFLKLCQNTIDTFQLAAIPATSVSFQSIILFSISLITSPLCSFSKHWCRCRAAKTTVTTTRSSLAMVHSVRQGNAWRRLRGDRDGEEGVVSFGSRERRICVSGGRAELTPVEVCRQSPVLP